MRSLPHPSFWSAFLEAVLCYGNPVEILDEVLESNCMEADAREIFALFMEDCSEELMEKAASKARAGRRGQIAAEHKYGRKRFYRHATTKRMAYLRKHHGHWKKRAPYHNKPGAGRPKGS